MIPQLPGMGSWQVPAAEPRQPGGRGLTVDGRPRSGRYLNELVRQDYKKRMPGQDIDPRILTELNAAAERAACELIHVSRRGDTLQLVLDHPDGVTLSHCVTVSRDASAMLDVEDFGGERYLLEVSSPGLDRELYSAKDYERFVGRPVRMTFLSGAKRRKETRIGRLEAFDFQAGGTVTFIDAQTQETLQVSLDDIKTTRLEVEL